MSEDATDKRQPDTACGAKARIGVPQIMDPYIADAGQMANALPLLVEAIKVRGDNLDESAYSQKARSKSQQSLQPIGADQSLPAP